MIRKYGFEFVAKIHLNNVHRSNITVPDDQHITRLFNIAAYTKEIVQAEYQMVPSPRSLINVQVLCENLINEARTQLYIQKNRRAAIVRQSRADIAQLLMSGQYDDAIARVDKLHNNECVLSAYGQIGQFSHTIHTNLGEISSRKRLSYKVVEAVSSLVYAASRCGELPELHQIRMLFKKHFGADFERTNVKLQPGNFVNTQMKYNLGTKSLSNDVKIAMTLEIAREYNMPLRSDQIREKKPVPRRESVNSKGEKKPVPRRESMNSKGEKKPVPRRESLNSKGNDQREASKVKATLRKIGSKFSMFSPGSLIYKCNGKTTSSKRHASIQTDGTYGKLDGPRHKNKMKNQTILKKLGVSWRRSYSGRRLLRNDSLSSQSTNVHPKLPDYDELVATFTEYKEEHKKSNPNDRTPRDLIDGLLSRKFYLVDIAADVITPLPVRKPTSHKYGFEFVGTIRLRNLHTSNVDIPPDSGHNKTVQ
ncbi:hypothetical protein RHMOL_Rhmol06G0281800 [Rhododendron molle]|uniref:Uncharacterized protein n=1 Tax=Rhododendron molle TaxID=49168 RepID=A0ACC0NI89_RHOML|nr:hypothetical protein RHMOL_Rhmol06G0281800 [Rhododendron molle]